MSVTSLIRQKLPSQPPPQRLDKMTAVRTFLLATLVVCCIASSDAFFEALSMKCQCLKYTPKPINPREFHHIEIIPQGPRCRQVEIIITLKNGNKVCVSPDAIWIKSIIQFIVNSKKNQH